MLDPLMKPSTVAVVGASRTPGKVGHVIVANLLDGGFGGTIVPINPSAGDILGLPCYPDFKTYGKTVDLSILSVPTQAVMSAATLSLDAGAKALCVITAGFKEMSAEGAQLEKDLARLVRSRNARLLGPNCLGLINTRHSMNASFAKKMPKQGNISVLSQSGALCTAILDWAISRGLGFAKLISMGNKADIDETMLIEALAEDDETRVIVAYLESIGSGKEFIKEAEAAAGKKPVVVLKVGTTAAGAQAASSHTGSLAGADIAYGAAFKRSGVVRAETFEALFDYATAFSMQPLPRGNRVAIITNAGGPGIMAADAVEDVGMKVAGLSDETRRYLKSHLPKAASVNNPIDVLGDADPERYALALEAAQAEEEVDAIVILLTPQAMTRPRETAQVIAENSRGKKKPVLLSFMGGEDVASGRDLLVESDLPDFPSPERAVGALKAMVDYAAWLSRPARVVRRFPVNRRRVERIIGRCQRMKRFQVAEAEAKEIMRAYNFQIPPGHIATNEEEAVDVAVKIGMPVAMKIVSPDIIHKSDMGGVKLHLETVEAVRDAYDLMMLRIQRKIPEARLEGVYVEAMCSKAREVILGTTRDPQFGPMLMFGLGGIFVEVMKDVTFHLAPITHEEAMQMLKNTRSFAFLEGVRGQASVDIDGIASCLQRLSQLVTDFPQILELDINPLLVGPLGTEPIVADARITLSEKRA